MNRSLGRFLFVTSVLAVTGCATGSPDVHITINGVETVSREPLEAITPIQKGRQLSFCLAKGIVYSPFQSRNGSLQDPDYYSSHLSDYLRRDTPFESIETVGGDTEDIECDVLITPNTYLYVSPLSSIDVTMTLVAKSVAQPAVGMTAWVTEESSVESAASRLSRVIYNAFAPGTDLYSKVAPHRAEAAKSFEVEAARYRSLAVKPALPEEARKYMVQAEAAVRRQSFSEAAARYRDALKIAPWWPEGYFNRALLLGETGEYKKAIASMKKYMTLVPAAPDAQAAQDKIYEWEGLANKASDH